MPREEEERRSSDELLALQEMLERDGEDSRDITRFARHAARSAVCSLVWLIRLYRAVLKTETAENRPEVRLLDAAEVGGMTGLSTKTIRRHARIGTLPSMRVGKRVVFREDDVDRWLTMLRERQRGNGNGDNSGG